MQFAALVRVEASNAAVVLVTAVLVLLAWAWRHRMGQHARTAQEASESVLRSPRESRQDVPQEDAQTPRRQQRKEVQVAPPCSARLSLEVSTVKELKALLRSRKLEVSGNKAELIARIQAFQAQTPRLPGTMEVSPVDPCPHSRTVLGANGYAAWKKCAACGKMTERTMKQAGARTEYFVDGLDGRPHMRA